MEREIAREMEIGIEEESGIDSPRLASLVALIVSLVLVVGGAASAAGSDKASQSGKKTQVNTVTTTTHTLQACVLRPFDRLYVDVAYSENAARQKVNKRCEKVEGTYNIFCQVEKAECSEVRFRSKN
ncbi:MAG: hypothetical protein AAGI11_05660 [Pseudomonadota bacterium]